MYKRIAHIQRSGVQNPTRSCCKTLHSAHLRMITGSQKGSEYLYEQDGQIKDQEKWDYKSALLGVSSELRAKKKRPIFNLDMAIEDYITSSFTNVPITGIRKADDGEIPAKKKPQKASSTDTSFFLLPKINKDIVIPPPRIYASPQQKLQAIQESKALHAHLENYRYNHKSPYQQIEYKNQYIIEDLDNFFDKERLRREKENYREPGFARQMLLEGDKSR